MKTNLNTLIKMFEAAGPVKSSWWNDVMRVVETINEDPTVKILKKEWSSAYLKSYVERPKLNLNDINAWSTYDGEECINIVFNVEDKKGQKYISCNASIYDGTSFGGHRLNLRFTATIMLPIEYALKLENSINYQFDKHLERSYENYLEIQKSNWINDLKTQILK